MIDKLQSYPTLISEVVKYEHRLDGTLEQFKAVVLLIDGTKLHINEVWVENTLHKYAYYRLNLDGEVIQGWDNVPHHSHISTYPHHTHIGDQVDISHLRSLHNVLEKLEKCFSDKLLDQDATKDTNNE